MKKRTINQMKQLARKRGGQCLSKEYVNNKTKLKWKCRCGYIWESRADHIINGHWCPNCAGVVKLSLNIAIDLATKNKGKCLSKKYINNKTKLEWECEFGHKWFATLDSLKSQKTWCKKCDANSRKNLLSDAKKIAENRNGKCLAKKYINNYEKMLWQCEYDHTWYASFKDVKSVSWCPRCKYNLKKNSIEDAIKLAKKNNGSCLSKKYINSRSIMAWQCEYGHIWNTKYCKVRTGSWCPVCSSHKKQRKLTKIVEKIFNEKAIVNNRPNWLKNPDTKYNLEIDIFLPKSKIAIEYNGEQHYIPIKFSKNISNEDAINKLKEIQKRDKLKKKLIKKSGLVKHFIIFTYKNIIEYENVEKIIRKKIYDE